MGIRVNKRMGWGKIYPDSMIKNIVVEGFDFWEGKKLTKYKKFLDKKYEKLNKDGYKEFSIDSAMWDAEKAEKTLFSDLVTKIESRSNQSIILVTPYSNVKDWHRHDDDMDYNEEVYSYAEKQEEFNTIAKVKFLPSAPYPYEGWINKETHEQLTHKKLAGYRTLKDMVKLTEARGEPLPEKYLREQLEELNLNSLEELSTKIVPNIPNEVRDAVEWGNLFRNENEIYDYRPMVVTYWE